MTNAQYEIEEYRDIETLNMYRERLEAGYTKEEIMRSIHAKGRDNGRTPMQWNDGENAGFTTGTPWIKVNPNYKDINAESQVKDPHSVFSCYKRLVQMRKEYPVFVDGRFRLLLEEDENIFAYERQTAEQTLLVICNFYEKTLEMPLQDSCKDMELLIGNYEDMTKPEVLRPYEARIYLKNN